MILNDIIQYEGINCQVVDIPVNANTECCILIPVHNEQLNDYVGKYSGNDFLKDDWNRHYSYTPIAIKDKQIYTVPIRNIKTQEQFNFDTL